MNRKIIDSDCFDLEHEMQQFLESRGMKEHEEFGTMEARMLDVQPSPKPEKLFSSQDNYVI